MDEPLRIGDLEIPAAELSWRFVETPFLRRKQKKYKSL